MHCLLALRYKYIYGDGIMTFNFNYVTTPINQLSRAALGWLFTRQNKSHKAVTINRPYQANPAGGMFGQLVSRNETHRP
jgi:hypothetical protein